VWANVLLWYYNIIMVRLQNNIIVHTYVVQGNSPSEFLLYLFFNNAQQISKKEFSNFQIRLKIACYIFKLFVQKISIIWKYYAHRVRLKIPKKQNLNPSLSNEKWRLTCLRTNHSNKYKCTNTYTVFRDR